MDLRKRLIKLGAEHPEMQEDLRPILAEIDKTARGNSGIEILVNTALDAVTEATDAQVSRLSNWLDIAPRGALDDNRRVRALLSEAEAKLRQAQKLARKADAELIRLHGAARRSL